MSTDTNESAPPPVIVEVCERLMDCWYVYGKDTAHRMPTYHACVQGTAYWDCGRSPNGALVNLRHTHPEQFAGRECTVIFLEGARSR